MSLWRQLARGLRALTHRSAADRDIADEVQHYLEQATAAHVARGLPPAEALRAARLELGGVTRVREEVRGYGWENVVETGLADLRYAVRRLRGAPGFTAVTVLTLALGIGGTTAIFSAVHPILFEPLPYPHAERIVTVTDAAADGTSIDVTFGTYRELDARSRSFAATAVAKPWQPTLVGREQPERLDGQRVSASYFRVLGVAPALGRDFLPSDDRPRGPQVVILAHALARRVGAVVGQPIRLDGNDYLVVGVLPPGFENVLLPSAELWAPLQYETSFGPNDREWGHHLRMVARLRPAVDVGDAARELAAIARTPVADFPRVPWASLAQGLLVGSLQQDITRGVRSTLLAVLGAVVLVLAIAGVNVTNLLLARGVQRRGEFAMRTALGAGQARLTRQLLTESLLLALIAGALGMAVAELGVRAVIALSPPGLPRIGAIRVDGAVFAFGLLLTTLVGLLVGIVPALQAARGDLHAALQQAGRRAAGSHRRTRGGLVVAEVALALVLLVGAGLLLRSLERLFAVPVGFDASHILTMQVQVTGERFRSDSARNRFFARALDEVRRVPGVTAAGFTTLLPLSGDLDVFGVRFEGSTQPEDGAALRYAVTPGYLQAMRIPLLQGRTLDAHDVAGSPLVALVNASFARRSFGDGAAIGRRVHFGPDDDRWYTIVGIVGDVKQTSLAAGDESAIYVTPSQWSWTDQVMSLVVRAQGDAAALTPAIRRAIWSVDRDQPIVRVATMDELIARSQAGRRFALVLFEAFALVALVLAAAGIYGVLSGSVAERAREIGVRSALGASRGRILALVLGQGLGLTGLGVALGLAGAAAASRAIAAMLFGVSRLDPVTYLGVVGLLVAVAALACGLPAWRAARIDPAITLRSE
ncbi:MAG TPA: ABC transporter permease [Gemmatimonadaceae bacterium]|nr:ABC transporter permease [Gemmatimonadaceae bacterium]